MELEKNKIADLDMYLTRMQKSMLDKIFFIDKVFEPFKYIVDFGCANGDLIKLLKKLFNEYEYIGYDLSERMIKEAEKNVPNTVFCSDWNSISIPFETALLNISSVVHEVYSYSTAEEIKSFWNTVFGNGFKYISIRDMMVSDFLDVPADADKLSKVKSNDAFRGHLSDFEREWGRITTQKQLVHYLLKYSYTQNWEREVRENYLGLTLEGVRKLIPNNYRISYVEHFTLPYLKWQVRRDFGIDLTEPTHIKLILERNE